jgi:tRNA (guanine-N7-)-methyltransferase
VPVESAPRDLIFSLPSIDDPIDLARLFSNGRPLEVELGCGDGSFLVQYAASHPGHNFIGVERLLGRLRKVNRRGARAGLENLRLVRIEAGYFLQYLLPPNSVAALHIYFPDPWPKRKHWKHRLIDEKFPGLAARVLRREGAVHLRTDDIPYFAQMTGVFKSAPQFEPFDTPAELSAVVTDFEREFAARGVATLRASYRLAGSGRSNETGGVRIEE